MQCLAWPSLTSREVTSLGRRRALTRLDIDGSMLATHTFVHEFVLPAAAAVAAGLGGTGNPRLCRSRYRSAVHGGCLGLHRGKGELMLIGN